MSLPAPAWSAKDAQKFAVSLEAPARVAVNAGDATFTAAVKITNIGSEPISSQQDFFLSYHLLDSRGAMLRHDNVRTHLQPIAPGQSATIAMKLEPMAKLGEFILDVDVVHEGVAWLKQLGGATARIQLTVEKPAPPYSAKFVHIEGPSSILVGGFLDLAVTIRNAGSLTWHNSGKNPVFLSFHIFDTKGAPIAHDGLRTALPRPVGPHQEAVLPLRIPASAFPGVGVYRVVLDLVREGVTWFADKGSEPHELQLAVFPLNPSTLQDKDLAHPTASLIDSDITDLNVLWQHIRFTFAAAQRSMRSGGRPFAVWLAGSGIPQVRVRDSSTAELGARWFADKAYLLDWALLHATRQQPDGSIFDWVDGAGRADKSTAATDQEAAWVLGVARYVDSTGDARILSEPLQGLRLIERLDAALEHVWSAKRDAQTGLLLRAHTIDGGDLDLVDSDQKASTTDAHTVWTVGIYDQSMFVLAAQALAQLHALPLHDPQSAARWTERAQFIADRTRELLWQPARGFFLVHHHVSHLEHPFDESDMFALAGNTMAVLAGIASPEMAARIFQTAQARKRTFGMTTVSGMMLPPYPAGTYRQPAVARPYSYQNGGQWDWFGARLVTAMYEQGWSGLATASLVEIASKVSRNAGIHEWDDRQGYPRGSEFFTGAAGTLTQAIVEGLYGVHLHADGLEISPRLARHAGRIALREPATERSIAYDYSFDAKSDVVQLALYTDRKGSVAFKILIPDAAFAATGRTARSVEVNGQAQPFTIVATGRDIYVAFQVEPVAAETRIRVALQHGAGAPGR